MWLFKKKKKPMVISLNGPEQYHFDDIPITKETFCKAGTNDKAIFLSINEYDRLKEIERKYNKDKT